MVNTLGMCFTCAVVGCFCRHLAVNAGVDWVSCRPGDTLSVGCAPVVVVQEAAVRVVHLSPDAPAVDVFANGTGPVVSGQTFLQGVGPLNVPEGSYTFDVAPSGAGIGASVLNVPNLVFRVTLHIRWSHSINWLISKRSTDRLLGGYRD